MATATTSSKSRAPRPVRFNPFHKDYFTDPYDMYRRLREEDPVHRTLGMWVLTRYEDVKEVMGNHAVFSSNQIPDLIKAQAAQMGENTPDKFRHMEGFGKKAIVFTDKPDHTRLRRLVNKCYSPKSIAARREVICRQVDRVVDDIAGRGEFDFVQHFADVVPLRVMSDMMRLPQEARPKIHQWTRNIRDLLEPGLLSVEKFFACQQVLRDYMEFFRGVVAERRASPGDDLVSDLIGSTSQDDDRLSEEEVIYACIMTFVAGHETTKCLLSSGMNALLQHPDQLRLLREDRSLMKTAINEMLRYDSPLQQTKRKVLQDVEIGGKTLRRGDQVLLVISAANRDPGIFDEPEQFDIRRQHNPHIAFGLGIHNCLGGQLSVEEMEVSFNGLLDRFPQMNFGAGPGTWQTSSFILRGLENLPVVFR